MSAAITAIGISTVAALYMAEQQRQAQSNADEELKQSKITAQNEKDWQNKKKGINDQNAANTALRLRGDSTGPAVTTTPVGGAASAPNLGVLGGVGGIGNLLNGGQQLPGVSTNSKMNSPLGL